MLALDKPESTRQSATISTEIAFEERKAKLHNQFTAFNASAADIFAGDTLIVEDGDDEDIDGGWEGEAGLPGRRATSDETREEAEDEEDEIGDLEEDDDFVLPSDPSQLPEILNVTTEFAGVVGLDLRLPSRVSEAERKDFPEEIMALELQLRVGHANDCLESLKEALGYLALLYRTKVRNAKGSQDRKTRAWKEVKMASRKIKCVVRKYETSRRAIAALAPGDSDYAKYQRIRHSDLAVPQDILSENRLYQRNSHLSWIWRVAAHTEGGEEDDAWMSECESTVSSLQKPADHP